MRFVNLTAHPVNEVTTGLTIPLSGQEARIGNPNKYLETINGIPVCTDNEDAVIIGLPEPIEGTVYIVSNLVLNFCQDRPDVYGVGSTVKGPNKQVIGCRGFRK